MKIPKELKSKEWRLNHLYKTQHKLSGKTVTFKMTRALRYFHEHKHLRNIVLKSRQLFFTTFEGLDMLDDCVFEKNMHALFIADTKENAEDLFFKKVGFALMPDNFKLHEFLNFKAQTKSSLAFDSKGSQSTFTVKTSGRGGSFRRAHVSEFGKICKKYPENAKEVVTGLIPAIPSTGRLDIESTAEGDFGYFHDMFWEAWDRKRPPGPKEFKAFFFNWQWDDLELNAIKTPIPTSQMDQGNKFAEYQKKHNLTDIEITYYYNAWLSLTKNWDLLRQEYPTTPEEAFLSSGRKFFTQDAVQVQSKNADVGDMLATNIGEHWTIYRQPVKGRIYAVGADTAGGNGGDNATLEVFDITNPKRVEQVAEWVSDKHSADLQGDEAVYIAEKYNHAIIVPESNFHGHTFINQIKGKYDNIYQEEFRDNVLDKMSKRLGWTSTGKSRPLILTRLKRFLDDYSIIIYSRKLVIEARTFPQDKVDEQKVKEEEIGHWDRLIACALALEGMEQGGSGMYVPKTEDDDDIENTNQLSWEEKFGLV